MSVFLGTPLVDMLKKKIEQLPLSPPHCSTNKDHHTTRYRAKKERYLIYLVIYLMEIV